MEYFFADEAKDGSLIVLKEEEHLHCVKVKRHKVGDTIDVINGKGLVFNTRIKEIKRSETLLEIMKTTEVPDTSKPIIIGISPTKNPSRLEWFIEKATEIGVRRIFIILCERSDKKTIKEERLTKITISAMKQSGRLWLPDIKVYTSIHQVPFQDMLKDYQKFIAYCETPEPTLKHVAEPDKPAFIAIGPEGDFTRDEIDFALSQQCVAVSLGPNRLRTETAGIFALSTLVLI